MTRELIMDALAEVVVEQGVRRFSVDDVADRAGVSVRTLYRYYPTHDELLAGLLERMAATLGTNETVSPAPTTLDDAIGMIGPRVQVFGQYDTLARAAVALTAATEVGDPAENRLLADFSAARRERNVGMKALLAQDLPGLPDEMIDQLFAVVRMMASIAGWAQATGPTGQLDDESAAIACQWAIRTLVERARELEADGAESFEEDL